MSELVKEIYRRAFEASEVISKYMHETPLERSATFSRMCGCDVYLKLENLQKTGAFKVRGALYKVWRLVRGNGVKGVVAASAGNHAQGVAYAASIFGLRSVIVMPETASISKVEATKGYGAEVVLYGRIYDDCERKALEIARDEGLTFIHAFNDLDVMAGQGTIAVEVLKQLIDFDVIVVQIGGGGLISGIASVIKTLRPNVRVIGVEPTNVPKTVEALRAGKPVTIKPKPTIADGLAVKQIGDLTFKVITELVDDVVTVDEDEIAKAIYLLLERGKVLSEGAGAAGLAALLAGKVNVGGKRVVTIISGGNVDLNVIYRILLRGLASEGRIASITGYVLDVPGELHRILGVIAKYRGNVLDIHHERVATKALAWHAKVTILLEVPNRGVLKEIMRELSRLGYEFIED